jgi:hypothetical protein
MFYICKKFGVILYQFPDRLERTFLHNRTAGSALKTMVSVIFCQLVTFSIWGCPKIYIDAYVLHGPRPNICKKFDVLLYQFPDHFERTFLYNRTAESQRKTMVSVIFCQLVTFSIWGCPKIYIDAYVLHGPLGL